MKDRWRRLERVERLRRAAETLRQDGFEEPAELLAILAELVERDVIVLGAVAEGAP